MIKYKIRSSDWLSFPLIIVNFNHFFIQPAPGHYCVEDHVITQYDLLFTCLVSGHAC